MPEHKKEVVTWHVDEISRARKDFGQIKSTRKEVYIRWVAPLDGWVKINVDGAYKREAKLAGCGGLIRGSDGVWIQGLARKLSVCSAIKAELWAV